VEGPLLLVLLAPLSDELLAGAGAAAAAAVPAAGAEVAAAQPPLKSVAYQPDPFS